MQKKKYLKYLYLLLLLQGLSFSYSFAASCGLASQSVYTSAPTRYLCASGTPSVVSSRTAQGTYTWTCDGIACSTLAATEVYQCTAPHVSCGSANAQLSSQFPDDASACINGSPINKKTGTARYLWDCQGVNGGAIAYGCWAKVAAGGTSSNLGNLGYYLNSIRGFVAIKSNNILASVGSYFSDVDLLVSSTYTEIQEHGVCKGVKNSGTDVFIPTKTQDEWSAFISNKPSEVSLTDCAPSGVGGCSVFGTTLAEGATTGGYSVASSTDCSSMSGTITCSVDANGNYVTNAGSYSYQSCNQIVYNSCPLPATLGGGTLLHGQTIVAYDRQLNACHPNTRKCVNGTLDAGVVGGVNGLQYIYANCCTETTWTVVPGATCTTGCPSTIKKVSSCGRQYDFNCDTNPYQYCAGCYWGMNNQNYLAHGQTVSGYDASCNPTTVSCNNSIVSPSDAKDAYQCIYMPSCTGPGTPGCTTINSFAGETTDGNYSCEKNGYVIYCTTKPCNQYGCSLSFEPCYELDAECRARCTNIDSSIVDYGYGIGLDSSYPNGDPRSWGCYEGSEWNSYTPDGPGLIDEMGLFMCNYDGGWYNGIYYRPGQGYCSHRYMPNVGFYGCGDGICADGENGNPSGQESPFSDNDHFCSEDCGIGVIPQCGGAKNECFRGTYIENSTNNSNDDYWKCHGTYSFDDVDCYLSPTGPVCSSSTLYACIRGTPALQTNLGGGNYWRECGNAEGNIICRHYVSPMCALDSNSIGLPAPSCYIGTVSNVNRSYEERYENGFYYGYNRPMSWTCTYNGIGKSCACTYPSTLNNGCNF